MAFVMSVPVLVRVGTLAYSGRNSRRTIPECKTKRLALAEPFGHQAADFVASQEIDAFLMKHWKTPAKTKQISLLYISGLPARDGEWHGSSQPGSIGTFSEREQCKATEP